MHAPSDVGGAQADVICAEPENETRRAKLPPASGQKELLTARIASPRIACRVIGQLDVIVARRITSCQIGIILASSQL